MHFSSNLKLLRKRRKLSQEDLALALDTKRSTLSGYENGTSEPNMELLIRISDHFHVSLDKLLKVDLSTLRESVLSQIEQGFDMDVTGTRLRVLATTVSEENEDNIELVPKKAKAGYTQGYADPEFIKILSSFRLPFLDRSKKYRTFQISGDSMPPVSDGSYVTGEYLQNWKLIKNGYPYVVITKDEGIVFKVLHNNIEDRGTLTMVSTNPDYAPYEIHIEEILEIWKFIHFISSELPEPNLSKNTLASTVVNLQKEVNEIKNRLKH